MIVLIVSKDWLKWNQTVLTSHVDHVVDPPIHLSHPSGWMPQTLKRIHQHDAAPDADPDAFDGFKH